MSMGPLFGGGDYFQPRGPYGPWMGCGCSSIFIILAGILLILSLVIGLGVAFMGLAFHHERRHRESLGKHPAREPEIPMPVGT
jgi:hypothetical protein